MFFDNNEYFNVVNNNEDYLEKFLRGNMFDNEFIPYKNMTYVMPDIKSDREKKLFKIMENTFKVIDYNLYLDVNPSDLEILKEYNNATEKLELLKKEYEEKYGPLCITNGGYNSYKWISSPWPWEKDGGMYV